MKVNDDYAAMALAIDLAAKAPRRGERPFGCIIVDEHFNVLAARYGSESPLDPTRHSELHAIKEACKRRSPNLFLKGCTLFSTHEPCTMCCGAINHAKIATVVFGSYRIDLPSLFRERDRTAVEILQDTTHPPMVIGGCLRERCIKLFAHELVDCDFDCEPHGGPHACMCHPA